MKINKLNAGAWIVLIAAVLMLVATILFQVSIGTSQQYFDVSTNGGIIALDVVGIILAVAAVIVSTFGSEEGQSNRKQLLFPEHGPRYYGCKNRYEHNAQVLQHCGCGRI